MSPAAPADISCRSSIPSYSSINSFGMPSWLAPGIPFTPCKAIYASDLPLQSSLREGCIQQFGHRMDKLSRSWHVCYLRFLGHQSTCRGGNTADLSKCLHIWQFVSMSGKMGSLEYFHHQVHETELYLFCKQ